MPHLVETYALTTGLRIDKMQTYEQFYPLPDGFDSYILVSSGSGMGAKNYSYFNDVLWLVREPLISRKIKVIQVGGKDDESIGCDLDLRGLTSLYQLCFLVKNCLLTLSNDTSIVHLAGRYNKKIVAVYGLTDPKISRAYFGNPENQIYVTPVFENRSPSFNPKESPKTVDEIRPEEIAEKVAKLLDFPHKDIDTLYIGEQYRFNAIEIIPNHMISSTSFPTHILNIRLDYGGSEDIVYAILSQRKCNVMTDKPLNVSVLNQLRRNIVNIIYNVTENHAPKFVEELHRAAIPYALISYLPTEQLNKIKLSYFDYNYIHPKKYKVRDLMPNIEFISDDTRFRTNKIILSMGKAYASRAHFNNDEPFEPVGGIEHKILDTPDFWKEAEFFYIFNPKSLQSQP